MAMDSSKYPIKVSVVLPTYNQARYLPGALQTILTQTFTNFELIIVNDGSTDETANMLATLQHPNIRVITQENQGLPNALNNGFAVARGEYFTWTSTDNMVSPIWLEELVRALDNAAPEVSYAFSHYAVVDDNGKMLFTNQDLHFDLPTLLTRHTGNASFLYRSELARMVGPYDTSLTYAEDLDMWVRMAEHTSAVLVESILYYYRQHDQSMTAQQDKVAKATMDLVNKYLAKTGGKFDVDKLFPSIALSADPVLERWKARVYLVTLGMSATFYCPVDALVDQLFSAMHEHYDRSIVGNVVHLFVKAQRWDLAQQVVEIYGEKDTSDFMKSLVDIVSRRAHDDLQKVPFATLEEKHLASDCSGSRTQMQLLRNLAPVAEKPVKMQEFSFENLITDLINQLEDMQDHPDIWRNLASFRSPEEKTFLNSLRLYITGLMNIPQDPQALILMRVLEAVCLAYTGNVMLAKNRLQYLHSQNPQFAVISGLLNYLNQDEALLSMTT